MFYDTKLYVITHTVETNMDDPITPINKFLMTVLNYEEGFTVRLAVIWNGLLIITYYSKTVDN